MKKIGENNRDKHVNIKKRWSEFIIENLNTKQLLEVINKAVELNLSQEFIDLLRAEVNKRYTVHLQKEDISPQRS
ncbi:sporulation histidine kinase inhibitor Sda [Paenibacillus sp. BSR1-1]|uniref:sporulation histidine kinase inhibitor Sda n=1 Tax=Paenibacillus sp. BSR1-1 TaxID=3020845 RepID=UPI0025B23603|nr:sporulation histidine kinase inhibitor Sda [Paenibacillus sp. BSR1-1]MDN3016939.1 sporulation histidine kinase inhibitor Sda [Paenibacillus sp. BSR1-1]